MNNFIPFPELHPALRILACLLALVLVVWSTVLIVILLALYLCAIIVSDLVQVFILTPYNTLFGQRRQKPRLK